MKRSVKQIMVAGEVRYKYKKIIQMLRPQNCWTHDLAEQKTW